MYDYLIAVLAFSSSVHKSTAQVYCTLIPTPTTLLFGTLVDCPTAATLAQADC